MEMMIDDATKGDERQKLPRFSAFSWTPNHCKIKINTLLIAKIFSRAYSKLGKKCRPVLTQDVGLQS